MSLSNMETKINTNTQEQFRNHPLLDNLTQKLEEMDTWDGDNSGLQEDMANAVKESVDKINELKELLEELDLTY